MAFCLLGGDLINFSVPGGQKKLLDCCLQGEIGAQADTMATIISSLYF